jgi:hypothetical protein
LRGDLYGDQHAERVMIRAMNVDVDPEAVDSEAVAALVDRFVAATERGDIGTTSIRSK